MSERICNFDGCTGPVYARGWCITHYGRVRRHGDPNRVDRSGCKPGPAKQCSVADCSGPVNSHGLCGMHDQRRRRTGDPLAPSKVILDMEERFLAKVRREPGPDGCWTWTAAINRDGYAEFGDGAGEVVGGHRWSYEHFAEQIPDGLTLDHLCHSRAVETGTCAGGVTCPHRRCVNPAHLQPVPKIINNQRGVFQGKLSGELVASLHARYLAGESVIALALEVDVQRGALYKRFRRIAA